jgi:hypothetical protein
VEQTVERINAAVHVLGRKVRYRVDPGNASTGVSYVLVEMQPYLTAVRQTAIGRRPREAVRYLEGLLQALQGIGIEDRTERRRNGQPMADPGSIPRDPRADWCAINQIHGAHGEGAKGGACPGLSANI